MKQTLTSERSSPVPGAQALGDWEPPALHSEDTKHGKNELRMSRLFHAMCLFVLFVVASAASFSGFYQKWHFREAGTRGWDAGAEFGKMIDGTARRPYIYRQLLPSAANWLTRALP